MAQIVVKTFDYYNTRTVLPGYTVPGYEKETETSRAYYSTDFSSNPIGSKVDFFNNLYDPCLSIYAPNPVFDAPIALSAMEPQWFDGWWDEAMFYSHPKTLQKLKTDSPAVYQDFSESVGTLTYVATDEDPVNPILNPKIPAPILTQIKLAKKKSKSNFKGYTPSNMGPSQLELVNQINAFTESVVRLRTEIEVVNGVLKNKLPFAVALAGNLITPTDWKAPSKIEGIQTQVDSINNVIKKPGRLLSQGIDQLNKFFSQIKIPALPSLSKIISTIVPEMPAISKIFNRIKAGTSVVKSVVSNAQQAIANVVGAAEQVKEGVGSVVGTINTETQKIVQVGASVAQVGAATKAAAVSVQDLNKAVTKGGVSSTLKFQSESALAGLNNNAAVIINTQVKNIKGNTAVTKVNTFQFPPKS